MEIFTWVYGIIYIDGRYLRYGRSNMYVRENFHWYRVFYYPFYTMFISLRYMVKLPRHPEIPWAFFAVYVHTALSLHQDVLILHCKKYMEQFPSMEVKAVFHSSMEGNFPLQISLVSKGLIPWTDGRFSILPRPMGIKKLFAQCVAKTVY